MTNCINTNLSLITLNLHLVTTTNFKYGPCPRFLHCIRCPAENKHTNIANKPQKHSIREKPKQNYSFHNLAVPLKVQCIIMTASSWNWYCSPNSKYWRVLFLPHPLPQTQRSHRLQDATRNKSTLANEPYSLRWWVVLFVFNIPLFR